MVPCVFSSLGVAKDNSTHKELVGTMFYSQTGEETQQDQHLQCPSAMGPL